MKKNLLKIKNQKGYALLFTIMIISVISVITAGLLNAATKQLILSSLAKDSQIAFYQADTAGDCALYFDLTNTPEEIESYIGKTFTCGGFDLDVSGSTEEYLLSPPQYISESSDPCFRINVKKNATTEATEVSAKGYNICDLDNPRAVERAITVRYD